MHSPIEIREGRLADAPALAQLLAQLGYPETQDYLERRMAQQLSHPDALLLVAVAGDNVVGFISLHIIAQLALAGDFCRVSYLCVAETLRGHGVGAMLEQCAELHARALGCDRIELHSNSHRQDAHRFYAGIGYEESPKYLIKRLAGAPQPAGDPPI